MYFMQTGLLLQPDICERLYIVFITSFDSKSGIKSNYLNGFQ